MMGALGTAIGNGAAHEMGHQLEQMQKGKFGLPIMDCGLSNPKPANGSYPIPCDGNDNFVYEFYNASGEPQFPDPPNGGAMFRYGLPGGQNGIPIQPAIHWGKSNECWLMTSAGLKCIN